MAETEAIGGPVTPAQVRIKYVFAPLGEEPNLPVPLLTSPVADSETISSIQAACLLGYIVFVFLWGYAEWLSYRYAYFIYL